MSYSIVRLVEPTRAPLELSLVRAHCRIGEWDREHDQYLAHLIQSATDLVERETGRQLMPATWQLKIDYLRGRADPYYLPMAPLVQVDKLELDGVDTDLTNYRVDTAFQPGRISPPAGEVWPLNVSARFEYQAGYSVIPSGITHALLLLVSHWFENREGVSLGMVATDIPFSVQRLLDNHAIGEEFFDYESGNYAPRAYR